MKALNKVIFAWSTQDVAEVKLALREGHLGGKKHTEDDIKALMESGAFKKNYYKYISTKTHRREVIVSNLTAWANEWLSKEDAETGERLGHKRTENAVALAKRNAEYIVDEPGVEYNVKLKKKPGEDHALHKYLSTRGEKVEP